MIIITDAQTKQELNRFDESTDVENLIKFRSSLITATEIGTLSISEAIHALYDVMQVGSAYGYDKDGKPFRVTVTD